MPKDHPHPNPKQDGGKKEITNRHVYVEPGVQIDFVEDLKEQHKTEHNESAAHSKNQLFWTKIATVLVFIYALLTAWQACSSHRAAKAAVESASATKDMFRDDQRAWVGPISFSAPNPPIAVGNQPTLAVTIVNSGKTPALKFRNKVAARELFKGSEFAPKYGPVEQLSLVVILPNTPAKLATHPRESVLHQAEVDGIKDGSIIVYFFGELMYDDVSGRSHATRFCVYLETDLTHFDGCDTYNDAN